MSVDAVWGALPDSDWATTESVHEASGIDYDRLNMVLNFLIRWKFVETRTEPNYCMGLSIRRRPGAMYPLALIHILRTLIGDEMNLGSSQNKASFAERVACRVCGGRSFNIIEKNLVECKRCHEHQWYTIEAGTLNRIRGKMDAVTQSTWFRNLRRH